MTDPRTTTIQYKLTDRQNKLVQAHVQNLFQLESEIKQAQEEERKAKELYEAKSATLNAGKLAFQLEQRAKENFLSYLAMEHVEGITETDNFSYRQEPDKSGKWVITFETNKPESTPVPDTNQVPEPTKE